METVVIHLPNREEWSRDQRLIEQNTSIMTTSASLSGIAHVQCLGAQIIDAPPPGLGVPQGIFELQTERFS